MPDSKLPVMCLECPYHEDDLPHIELNIGEKKDLVCNLGKTVQPINEKHYAAIFESVLTPQKTG